jgi:hypothetical protein
MTEILPRPQNIEETQLTMWVDESIWGHRLHDEQTPWLCILEMLCIAQSEVRNGQAFVEKEYNSLHYSTYPRLYLRNILFNNPHLEAITSEYLGDTERWNMWIKAIVNNVGGLNSPDFNYLKDRFFSFKDFAQLVKFIQSSSIEGDSNKRWSSKFVFPYGPDCLYEDLGVKDTNITNDRRFFGRTGELLYLMLCRSGRGEEILSHLQKLGIMASEYSSDHKGSKWNKWNKLIVALQPEHDRTVTKSSGKPPYLPYQKLPEYERLADDWLNILHCNLPDYDALPQIVTITGLHLIIYLLSRAKAVLGELEPPRFILEIIAPKKTIIRDLASDEYQKNNSLSQRAIEHYIRGTIELPEWQICLESFNPLEEAIELLQKRFAWLAKEDDLDGASSPDGLLDKLREKAVKRHKQHLAKCHSSWAREIGLSSSRGSRRTRYAPTDTLLRTLVLTCVPHRMEFQEFLQKLYQKYGFVIGDKQAEDIISSGNADREDFAANAERLERRLASIGLLKRLSDACAYVRNPFAVEVNSCKQLN